MKRAEIQQVENKENFRCITGYTKRTSHTEPISLIHKSRILSDRSHLNESCYTQLLESSH